MTAAKCRHFCRLIDLAVERCEEGNLREEFQVPRWIADLVVQLQAAAGEELIVPADTISAHGKLLDLRRHWMPECSPQEARDPERERRACATCGHPMSPLSKQSDCTACRRLQRLVPRTAAALAS